MGDSRRTSGMIQGATTVHPSYDLGQIKFAPFSQPILSKPGDGSFTGGDGRPVNGMNLHPVAGKTPFNSRKARNTNYDASFNSGNDFANSRKSPYDPNSSVK